MPFCILKHVRIDHRAEKSAAYSQYWARIRSSQYDDFAPPLQIVSYGEEQWHPRRMHERERSELYGVELVLEGDVDFVQDGAHYVVGPGEVYLLRRGVPHRYATGPSTHLSKQYVTIDGALLESVLLATGMDTVDHVVPEQPGLIREIFDTIGHLMTTKPDGFALELSAVAYRLLVVLSYSVSHRHPEPIRAAIEYIDQNLTRPLTTEDICRVAGLSQTHFNRLFRQHIGVSPKQFFISHKMAWAEHLLTDSQFTIKEIATTLGYEDPLYFSSQFRRHMGISPKFYRQSGGRRTRRK